MDYTIDLNKAWASEPEPKETAPFAERLRYKLAKSASKAKRERIQTEIMTPLELPAGPDPNMRTPAYLEMQLAGASQDNDIPHYVKQTVKRELLEALQVGQQWDVAPENRENLLRKYVNRCLRRDEDDLPITPFEQKLSELPWKLTAKISVERLETFIPEIEMILLEDIPARTKERLRKNGFGIKLVKDSVPEKPRDTPAEVFAIAVSLVQHLATILMNLPDKDGLVHVISASNPGSALLKYKEKLRAALSMPGELLTIDAEDLPPGFDLAKIDERDRAIFEKSVINAMGERFLLATDPKFADDMMARGLRLEFNQVEKKKGFFRR